MQNYAEFLKISSEKREEFLPANVIVREEGALKEVFANGVPRGFDKAKLGVQELKVVSLHVAKFKNTEIAEIVGLSKERVSQILNHPDAKAAIAEAAQEILKQTVATVRAEMQSHAHDAFRMVLTLMRTSRHDRIRLEASRDILKGAGVFEEKDDSGTAAIGAKEASIIASVIRELAEETEEFEPIGNSADVELLKASASDAEVIEEMTNGNSSAG